MFNNSSISYLTTLTVLLIAAFGFVKNTFRYIINQSEKSRVKNKDGTKKMIELRVSSLHVLKNAKNVLNTHNVKRYEQQPKCSCF